MSEVGFINPDKGYECDSCGHFNPFVAYVFAHWRVVLDTKCEKCGCPYTIICGHAAVRTNGPDAKKMKWFTALLAEYNESVQ